MMFVLTVGVAAAMYMDAKSSVGKISGTNLAPVRVAGMREQNEDVAHAASAVPQESLLQATMTDHHFRVMKQKYRDGPPEMHQQVDREWSTENFCRYIARSEGSNDATAYAKVSDCGDASSASCSASYVEGEKGNFHTCDLADAVCKQGESHECPWTFYMNDLMAKQKAETTSCEANVLEAKRSLDGLLHAVLKLEEEMRAQEQIIDGGKEAIEELVRQFKQEEENYEDDLVQCETEYVRRRSEDCVATPTSGCLQDFVDEMDEVEAIANAHRSEVNFVKDQGYQETASSSFVEGSAAMEACKSFVAFAAKSTHASAQPTACERTREELQQLITQTYDNLITLRDDMNQTIETERHECDHKAKSDWGALSASINRQIEEWAKKLKDAQDMIADTLQPRINDVQHASTKMRTHISELSDACELDGQVSQRLTDIWAKIKALQECPGHNDFVISIPAAATYVPAETNTPAPTPWRAA